MSVPIISSIVHHHGEHLGHCRVDALNAAISRRVVLIGTCGEFVGAGEILDGAGQIWEKRSGAPPQRNVAVYEDVGGALGSQFGGGDANMPARQLMRSAKRVRKEEDVGAAAGRDGRNSEVVDAYDQY